MFTPKRSIQSLDAIQRQSWRNSTALKSPLSSSVPDTMPGRTRLPLRRSVMSLIAKIVSLSRTSLHCACHLSQKTSLR